MGWFSKIVKPAIGWAANPMIGSAMAGKKILGAVNKIPSRGYDTQQDKLNQAYDLYAQNEKNNPYSKTYDPRLRKYQMDALNRLQGIAGSKNLDAQSQAQLNKIRLIGLRQLIVFGPCFFRQLVSLSINLSI